MVPGSEIPSVVPGKPALVLAPMEGVTDAPMRAFLSERGGFSFCVSEFLRVSQDPLSKKVFFRDIPELGHDCKTPSGLPVQIQLLGGHPERMAESARTAVACGAKGIDINFGCPAPTVNRNDGGATLLKFPDRIREIVRAVRDAVPIQYPVSAKLRLGWDQIDAVHLNAERAAEGGASWITIHGRTKFQGYTPPAYWQPIGEVRKALSIPVVANGEIWTLDDFKRCRDQTGSEHYMLGRGALADPSLPHQIARELGIRFSTPSQVHEENLSTVAQSWIPLIRRFAEVTAQFAERSEAPRSGRPAAITSRVKQWLRFVNLRFPSDWFQNAKRAQSLDEMLQILETAV
jgi:tRNA-dihydrouridine synthase C